MEQSDSTQSRLSGGRLVLALAAVVMIGLMVRLFWSGIMLAESAGRPFTVVMLTNPPALAEISPDRSRVRFTIAKEKAVQNEKTFRERAEAVLGAAPETARAGVYYFTPSTVTAAAFWENVRETALNYRTRPLLALPYFAGYARALLAGRTNIAPDEFYIITMSLTRARPDAFIAVLTPDPNPDGPAASDKLAAEQDPNAILKTLTIEVLNGSGKPGMALEATKYIRSLAGPAFKVDVLRHDNSAQRFAKTHFIAYTDREDDIAKLGSKLGLGVEINSAHHDIGDTDARLMLGGDFSLPR